MKTSLYSVVRDPDGVPHQIVGLTWLFAVAAALFSFFVLTVGGAASVVALVAVPALVIALGRSSEHKRETRTRR